MLVGVYIRRARTSCLMGGMRCWGVGIDQNVDCEFSTQHKVRGQSKWHVTAIAVQASNVCVCV